MSCIMARMSASVAGLYPATAAWVVGCAGVATWAGVSSSQPAKISASGRSTGAGAGTIDVGRTSGAAAWVRSFKANAALVKLSYAVCCLSGHGGGLLYVRLHNSKLEVVYTRSYYYKASGCYIGK